MNSSPKDKDEESSSSQPYVSLSEDNSPTTIFKTISLSSPTKKLAVPTDEKKIADLEKKIHLTQHSVNEFKKRRTFFIICAIISAVFLLSSFLVLLATVGFATPLAGLIALLHINMTISFIQNNLTFALSLAFTASSAPCLGYSLFQIHKNHVALDPLERDLLIDKLRLQVCDEKNPSIAICEDPPLAPPNFIL